MVHVKASDRIQAMSDDKKRTQQVASISSQYTI